MSEIRKNRILIVEDERIIAFHIQKLLLSFNYEVVDVIATADEAILVALRSNPDLILMDITLKSEKDGVYAADKIKEKLNVPIIFLTANTDEATFQRAKITEPYGYITKPFQTRELKTNIEIALYTHNMRKQLRESEQYLSATLRSINDGLIATDENNKIKFINNSALNILEVSYDFAINKELNEIYVTEDDSSEETLICNVLGYNSEKIIDKSILINKLLVNSKGKRIPIEENINIIFRTEKETEGKIVIFKDITKSREAKVELIRNRNYYLSLLTEFPLAIFQTNEMGEFNYFNNTWLNFRDKDIEKEIGIKWFNDIHPEDIGYFRNTYFDSINKKEPFAIEFRVKNNIGDYVWLYFSAGPFFDFNNKFKGFLGACIDISNRKKMEEALLNARIEAEKANEAKSRFIAMMSHELRTPMNGILGMVEILGDTELNGEQKKYMKLLSQSSLSLLNTLNTILDLTKIEAGKFVYEELKFNFIKTIKEHIETYEIIAKERGLEFLIEIQNDVPEFIMSDPLKIKQILSNLLNNSLKFTKRGFIKVSIEVDKSYKNIDEDEKINILIKVIDSGIGIPSDKHEMIFESFRQADDSTTRLYGGTGLGLSICRQLTNIMNGKIWVESIPDMGSTFYILLVTRKIN